MIIKAKDRDKIKWIHYNDTLFIPDELALADQSGYSVLNVEEELGMKAVGRIYFHWFEHLNYTTGEPVEVPIISGGELGVENRYLRAGVRVYTEEQVLQIINARLFEKDHEPCKVCKDWTEESKTFYTDSGRKKKHFEPFCYACGRRLKEK